MSHPGLLVLKQDLTLAQLTASSLSPDDFAVPGSSSSLVPKDFKAYQELLWHVAASLGVQVEFLQENTHKLLDILQPSTSWRIALTVNDAFLETSKFLWSTLALVPPTAKHMETRYFIFYAGI